jgi:hypothetical protein
MKSLLLAVAAFAAGIPMAHAADQGAFVSLSGGQSRSRIDPVLASDRNDTAFAVLGGYRWGVSHALSLGVEGGYTDLGKASNRTYDESVLDFDGVGHKTTWREIRSYNAKAYMLGLNGQWNITEQWNVSARYGMARYRTRLSIDTTGTYDSLSDTYKTDIKDRHDGAYYGLGVGYRITGHINLSATVDHYKPSFRDVPGDRFSSAIYVWGIRAEYMF